MAKTIEWTAQRPPRRRGRFFLLAIVAANFLGGGTALSYYVESLWFVDTIRESAPMGFAASLRVQANASAYVPKLIRVRFSHRVA